MTTIRLLGVRAYGSAGRSGAPPRSDSPVGPLVLESVPRPGESVRVDLGRPPAWLVTSERIDAVAADRRAAGGLPQPIALPADAPRWSDRDFYVTVTVVRHVEVRDTDVGGDAVQWLNPVVHQRLDEDFRAYCHPILGEVVAHLKSSFGLWYFDSLLADRVLVAADRRPTYGLLSGIPSSTGSQRAQLPNLEGVMERLSDALRRPLESRLRSAQRWYAEALVEADESKRFLWSFLGLEQLVHDLSRWHYASVVDRLGAFGRSLEESGARAPVSTLEMKFAVLALAFFPSDVDYDLQLFEKLRWAHDELRHGTIEAGQLPTADAVMLLNKYLNAAIRAHPAAAATGEEARR